MSMVLKLGWGGYILVIKYMIWYDIPYNILDIIRSRRKSIKERAKGGELAE